MDNNPKYHLTIQKHQNGGYSVCDYPPYNIGSSVVPLFAATTIDECLAFIKQEMEPKKHG